MWWGQGHHSTHCRPYEGSVPFLGLRPPSPVAPTSVPENSELSSVSFFPPSLGPRSGITQVLAHIRLFTYSSPLLMGWGSGSLSLGVRQWAEGGCSALRKPPPWPQNVPGGVAVAPAGRASAWGFQGESQAGDPSSGQEARAGALRRAGLGRGRLGRCGSRVLSQAFPRPGGGRVEQAQMANDLKSSYFKNKRCCCCDKGRHAWDANLGNWRKERSRGDQPARRDRHR